MKKKLTHNLGLKFAAVFCACCLWLISVNINDPVTQRIYTIDVQLQNLNTLTNAGKYVEVLDGTDSVRVTVRASRSVFSDFSEKNLVAIADIREMEDDNRVPIEVTTTKSDSKIEEISVDKEYVDINIENVMKMQKRISVKVANEPAEGYLLGNISTDQNAVIISGPESVVSRIASTAVEINVDGATSDVNITLPVHLYDADGREIDDSRLAMSVNEVFTTAAILQTKVVPIEYSVTGIPAEGYIYAGRQIITPETVMVAGKPSALKNLNSIVVEGALSVDGAEGNVTAEVELKQYLPDNIILADSQFDGISRVTAVLEKEAVRTIEVPMEQITLTNAPEGFVAKFRGIEDVVLVRFAGLQSALNELNVNEIRGTIDVTAFFATMGEEAEIAEGGYFPRANFELPEYVYVKDGGTVHIMLEEE